MRKLAAAVLTTAVAGGVMGLAPATAQTTDNTAFCDAVLVVDKLFAADEVDPTEGEAALSDLETTAPPEIATAVQTLTGTVRTAAQNNADPSEDPAFAESLAAVGEYVFTSCGWQTAEVTMAEYEFTGLPKSFTTGPVAIKITNEGAEVHELMTVRIKTKDKLKDLVKLSEKKAEKKLAFVGHELALAGGTTYAFLDFTKTGRYGAVCFIPVGTTDLADLQGEHGGGGKPHALKGMFKEFKVTKASA